MKVTTILLGVISGLYVLFLLFVFATQETLLLKPSVESTLNPDDYGLTTEDVWIETSYGVTLHGLYFPNAGAELAVIYRYDVSGKTGAGIELAMILLNSGASVFMYYTANDAHNADNFNEKDMYRDIEAAVETLVTEKEYGENDIVLYGRAAGGAVAAYAATRFDVRGLVLDSAYLNYRVVFRDHYPFVPGWFAKYEFPADRFLGEIRELPVMILHSLDDQFVGFHHGKGLYDILEPPKVLIELNGGHIESFTVSRGIIEQSWAFYIARLCSRCRMDMN
jgi:hypothetical protein